MDLYQHRVQYYETDQMGVVHHSNYIRWMEEARTDFLSRIGWDYDTLEHTGIISPVTAIDCKYKVSVLYADVIDIAVRIEEFKGVKLKLFYEMKRKDVVVCEGHSEHCFLDRDGKILNMKKVNPEFFYALSAYVE